MPHDEVFDLTFQISYNVEPFYVDVVLISGGVADPYDSRTGIVYFIPLDIHVNSNKATKVEMAMHAEKDAGTLYNGWATWFSIGH